MATVNPRMSNALLKKYNYTQYGPIFALGQRGCLLW